VISLFLGIPPVTLIGGIAGDIEASSWIYIRRVMPIGLKLLDLLLTLLPLARVKFSPGIPRRHCCSERKSQIPGGNSRQPLQTCGRVELAAKVVSARRRKEQETQTASGLPKEP